MQQIPDWFQRGIFNPDTKVDTKGSPVARPIVCLPYLDECTILLLDIIKVISG